MSRICLISDTHWGNRSGNVAYLDYQKKFLDKVFFPFLKKEKIESVIHLGDLVDNKRTINFQVLNRMKKDFLDPLWDTGLETIILCGNHDSFFNSKNDINSVRELLYGYDTFEIVDKEPSSYNNQIMLIPWISQENQEVCLNAINRGKTDYIFGHFDIQGFEQTKGHLSTVGFDRKVFYHYKQVISGHYHNRSREDNILYLGAPWEKDWGDLEETRGFGVFDTDNNKITFINNPFRFFKKIIFTDEMLTFLDLKSVNDQCIRLYCGKDSDQKKFDKFIKKLSDSNPLELTIIEENVAPETFVNELTENDSTLEFFKREIENQNSINPSLLWNVTEEIYREAINL